MLTNTMKIPKLIKTNPSDFPSSCDPPITGTSSKVKVKFLFFPFCYSKSMYCIGLKWKAGKIKLFYQEPIESYITSGTWAYMDGNIYMLGDENKRLNDVYVTSPLFFLSLPRPPPPSPMLTGRSRPHTAILRGKLFVLGDDRGFGYGETGPWGEFYEPDDDKWSPLPEPEDAYKYRYSPMMTAVLHSENKILLSFTFSRDLLAFNVENKKWDIYHKLHNSLPFSGRALVVDGVLYCCQAGVLYAYNLSTRLTLYITFAKMALRTTTQFEVLNLPADVNPSFHHLGGHFFCLIWRAINGSISFLNFQLSIRYNFNLKPYLHSSINSIDCIDPDLHAKAHFPCSLGYSSMKSFDSDIEAGDEELIEAFVEQNLVK